MPKLKKPRNYRRSVRKQQIINQLKIWYQNGYATEATMNKIAGALDMRPSTALTDILMEMVAEGDLEFVEREQPGRWTTRFYLLTSSHLIAEKFSHRHISVKRRGVAVGQLEMFS